MSLRTKNAGKSVIQIVILTDQGWLCADETIRETTDWAEVEHALRDQTWKTWDPETLEVGAPVAELDLSEIKGIGFFFPETPNKSKDCIGLDWFALSSSSMVVE
ncbi:MAG: hypothetical protein AAGA96_12690 [Verrucomicrobiota bacterium]